MMSADVKCPSSLPPKWTIRSASLVDLDSMVEIGLAAMPLDPQWHYRFPYRHEYPEETRKFTRLRYKTFLENENSQWQVMLAEALDVERLNRSKPVAFAIWETLNSVQGGNREAQSEVPNQAAALWPKGNVREHAYGSRRDGDAKRIHAWSETMSKSKKSLFDHRYGSKHFHLQILATHPSYQRRGAGASLCSWGIKLAERRAMTITVFASPMGELLYEHLGFRSVALVTVKADDDDESVTLAAMVYRPRRPTIPRLKRLLSFEAADPRMLGPRHATVVIQS